MVVDDEGVALAAFANDDSGELNKIINDVTT
jgi:hypothetical protein